MTKRETAESEYNRIVAQFTVPEGREEEYDDDSDDDLDWYMPEWNELTSEQQTEFVQVQVSNAEPGSEAPHGIKYWMEHDH